MFYHLNLGNTYEHWKKELSNIFPFFDFSTKNSITNDFRNFIDSSHTKPEIGELIFGKIFDDRGVQVPNDFGIFINKPTTVEQR